MTSWSDPSIVLTAGIAIFTFIYVILTGLIWRATLQNTKATREMLEASNRPYLGISGVTINHKDLLHSGIVVAIQNVGSVPSPRVEVDLKISLAGKVSRTFDGSGRPHFVAMPGESFRLTEDLTDAEHQRLKDGDLEADIRIRYCGASNKQYRTDAAYTYKDTEGFVIVSKEMQ